eukprot:CAMPEP_0119553084 /NCGR_PEP_ID=MMETSP1352-20130426/5918_1 /TAXON_ID=265584 /ORGANISM="Stauroneis constricta, Strain CCMP1120" /LENGTH=235 /DNA_ID=CAMNT_0007599425 /DNA_START=121 /DNA_END=828 /DNA_ORIENTATION=+
MTAWKSTVIACFLSALTFVDADLAINFVGGKAPARSEGCEGARKAATDELNKVAEICSNQATKEYYGVEDDHLVSTASASGHVISMVADKEDEEETITKPGGSVRGNSSPALTPFDHGHRNLQNCPRFCLATQNPSTQYYCCIIYDDCSYCNRRRRDLRELASHKIDSEDKDGGLILEDDLEDMVEKHMEGHKEMVKETCQAAFEEWLEADGKRQACFGSSAKAKVYVIDLEMAI